MSDKAQTLDELRAEVARLTELAFALQDSIGAKNNGLIELRTENARLKAEAIGLFIEIDQLRAALKRYGRHLNLCSFYRDGEHQRSPETACDCGLQAALT